MIYTCVMSIELFWSMDPAIDYSISLRVPFCTFLQPANPVKENFTRLPGTCQNGIVPFAWDVTNAVSPQT